MALAHPLHPNVSRSWNRRRNLWVRLCVSSWWPLFPSRSFVLIYIYIYFLFYFFFLGGGGGGGGGSWVECHLNVFFGLPIVSCSVINSLILGCLWPLVLVLNNISTIGIWRSANSHLPGCFCPWTFFQNIGFNMVPSDPFMSHLATELGYTAGEFQALQLIVLVAFRVGD